MAKEKKKKGSIVINIFILLLFLVGAGIFTYPTISNLWNEYRDAQLVTKYNEAVSNLSDDQYEKLWQGLRNTTQSTRLIQSWMPLTKTIMFSVIHTMRFWIQMVTD